MQRCYTCIIVIGDVDGDGYVNVLDSLEIQKYASGKVELNNRQLYAADVNDDNVADVLDATDIQKYSAEKITEFKKKI